MINYKVAKEIPISLIDNVDAGDLQSVVTEMDTLFKELVEARNKVKANRASIKEKMTVYDKARVEKLKKWLEDNKKGWCRVCDVVPEVEDIKMLYVEHHKTTSEGYTCGLDSSELIPTCSFCHQKLCDTRVNPKEYYGNETRYYRAVWRVDKYIFVVARTGILPGATRGADGVYRPQIEYSEFRDIDDKTKIKLLPDKVSPKVSKRVGLPPCIEFVPVGGIDSQNAHLAPYVGTAHEDYFVVNNKAMLKSVDGEFEDDED